MGDDHLLVLDGGASGGDLAALASALCRSLGAITALGVSGSSRADDR